MRLKPFFMIVFGMFMSWHCQRSIPLNALKSWEIVSSPDAIPAENFAAREFQSLFKQIRGVELPIVYTASADKGHIFIGPSKSLQQSSVATTADHLGEEGLRINISDNEIAIVGGRPRGTLYGVYEFFERYVGLRFLTEDHTYFPEKSDQIRLPKESFSYIPPLIFRWPYYGQVRFNHLFAARLRVNTTVTEDSLGGSTGQRLINHSFYRQLPVKKYGKSHPKYFALIDGKRVLDMWGGGPQPCVSNPEVMDIITRAVVDEIKEHPEYNNYSVSQNDNDAYCRCDSCEAINQREGSPMGAHLRFVNTIARRIKKIFPDKKIGTLAYWYTRKPPRHLKPADNVQIQLADIEACRVHAIDDPTCEKNKGFLKDLKGWAGKTNQLFIWTYMTDFRYYDLPFPNLKSISPNLQFYVDHGVQGVFAQAHGGSRIGDLSDLRVYVIARCLWDPQRDAWQEAQEFCRLHYGKAAPAVLEYLNFIQRNAEEKGIHPTCFATPKQLGLDREVALKLLDIFKRAMALADNEQIKRRVEKISLSAWRTLIEAGAEFKVEHNRLVRKYPPPYSDAIDRYVALADKYHLEMPDERTKWADYKKVLIEQYRDGIPVNVLENDYWRLIFEKQKSGRLLELFYKPRKINFLLAYDANLRYGTLEEWFGEKMEVKSFKGEVKSFTEKGKLVLLRPLQNGTVYKRTIFFDAQHPSVIHFQSEFVHSAPKPATYQLVVHPEFNVGSYAHDWQKIGAYVWKDGHWVQYNRQLWQDHGPDTELLLTAVEGGRHAFYNHEQQFGLIEQYDAHGVQKLRTWWVPEQKQLNLEIETSPVTLSEGQSWQFNYQLKFWESFE